MPQQRCRTRTSSPVGRHTEPLWREAVLQSKSPSLAGVMRQRNYEDILRRGRHNCQVFSFCYPLLTVSIRQPEVNMLVKGSQLIRLLNGFTSTNPIQWVFYTTNTVCPPHGCGLYSSCHTLKMSNNYRRIEWQVGHGVGMESFRTSMLMSHLSISSCSIKPARRSLEKRDDT